MPNPDTAPSTPYLLTKEEYYRERLAKLEEAYRCAESNPITSLSLLERLVGAIDYCEERLADISAILTTRLTLN